MRDLFFCCRAYLNYWLRSLPLIDVHHTIFQRLFQGKEFEKFAAHAPDFIAEKIGQMLYCPAIKELQKWKERGAKILLLSSSPDFLVKLIARSLGIATGIGSHYIVDHQGKLSALGFLLDGKWKAKFLHREVDSDMTIKTIAYTDHIHDLPLLESVSHPIVVNPERRLKRLARRRGWQIL